MFKPIDFDARFTKYAETWVREQLKAGKNPDVLEEQMPELYMRFINSPAHWLDGVAPAMYFAQWDDPAELIAMLREYEVQEIAVPDLLLERLTDIGEKSIPALMALAADESAQKSLRLTAVNLLVELDTSEPMSLCVEIVKGRGRDDDLADAAADLLRNLGMEPVDLMIAALDGASDEAADTFLDLLCNFKGIERVYEETVSRFLRDPEHRALHASYLAKLGDARAIEPLTKASELIDLNYLDYIEIRDAIEALGGSLTAEREFAGDPYYESMKRLEG